MKVNTIKISEEEYMDYINNPKDSEDRFIERHGNMSWVYGYGFYGMRLSESKGEYFVSYTLGSHCD